MLDVQSAYEVRMLDAMLEGHLECQSQCHGEFACTVKVTARMKCACTQTTIFACQGCVLYVYDAIAHSGICEDCMSDCADCWKIIPI